MALAQVGKVDVFMSTTDTLLQGGGEKVLIDISLENNIPILSSNKSGIEAGSTFGPVSDFFVLGKMSGEMAAQILKDNVQPAALQSKTQDPPLVLINKESAQKLGITVLEDSFTNFSYVN